LFNQSWIYISSGDEVNFLLGGIVIDKRKLVFKKRVLEKEKEKQE
jgi:hypothetical protein